MSISSNHIGPTVFLSPESDQVYHPAPQRQRADGPSFLRYGRPGEYLYSPPYTARAYDPSQSPIIYQNSRISSTISERSGHSRSDTLCEETNSSQVDHRDGAGTNTVKRFPSTTYRSSYRGIPQHTTHHSQSSSTASHKHVSDGNRTQNTGPRAHNDSADTDNDLPRESTEQNENNDEPVSKAPTPNQSSKIDRNKEGAFPTTDETLQKSTLVSPKTTTRPRFLRRRGVRNESDDKPEYTSRPNITTRPLPGFDSETGNPHLQRRIPNTQAIRAKGLTVGSDIHSQGDEHASQPPLVMEQGPIIYRPLERYLVSLNEDLIPLEPAAQMPMSAVPYVMVPQHLLHTIPEAPRGYHSMLPEARYQRPARRNMVYHWE